MSADTARLYDRFFSDLEYEQADSAIDELIATMMRLPTIARIRRAVIEPTTNLPTADDAWALATSKAPSFPILSARRPGCSAAPTTSAPPKTRS